MVKIKRVVLLAAALFLVAGCSSSSDPAADLDNVGGRDQKQGQDQDQGQDQGQELEWDDDNGGDTDLVLDDGDADAELDDGDADLEQDDGGNGDTDVMPDDGDDGDTDVAPDDGDEGDTDVEQEDDGGGEDTPTTLVLAIGTSDDALASYLMDGPSSSWNIFSGTSVPVGRHFDIGNVSYRTAFRFPGVLIPQGAVIEAATLAFYPTNEVDSSKNLWLSIYAESAANSAPFDPSNTNSGRPDQRLRTTAHIDRWLVRCNDDCTDITEYDCPQRKLDCWNRDIQFTCPKDLSDLVQEVINIPEWESGNAITIFLDNAATDQDGEKYKGRRSITAWDEERGLELRPTLTITYR